MSISLFKIFLKFSNRQIHRTSPALYLDKFVFEFVDGQTLALFQEGLFLLLPVGRLLTPRYVFLPLWDVRRGHPGPPDLCRKLPVPT